MSNGAKGDTCATAIHAVFEPDEILAFPKLIQRIKRKGRWKNSTIWEHLMALVVNLPPARHHWPKSKPFLFLHGDGRYELYKNTGYESLRDSGSIENRDHTRILIKPDRTARATRITHHPGLICPLVLVMIAARKPSHY